MCNIPSRPWLYLTRMLNENLRTYPVPFAVRMVQLLPELLSTASGMPVVSDCVSDLEGPQVFSAMQFEHEPDRADLVSVVHYLRGNVNLNLPEAWRAVMPQRL